jgi:dephospho-CoA kinase
MLRIGLTGGIGSGKTTVAKIFETLGVPVYYADDAAKRLMATHAPLKNAIIQNFGEDVYPGGTLNRKRLATIVFNDRQKLDLLNSLVHPLTIKDSDEWIQRQTSAYVIREAALLFESGAHKNLDKIIGVSAPENLRVKRVMDRDNVSETEIIQRMSHQMKEADKIKRCDFIIRNDEIHPVLPQVLELDKLFRKRNPK